MKRHHGLEQHEQTQPSARVVVTLSALIAFGPMAINLYLPAFPSMALDLATGIHQVELTLSAYMLGLGIGPLIIGPLSDRYGRLPILALGTTLFTFAAILCATTNDIELLMAYRFIQAVGGSDHRARNSPGHLSRPHGSERTVPGSVRNAHCAGNGTHRRRVPVNVVRLAR